LIDIYLITGFLGAGKTTLMKNLLKVFENDKVALIVNEFGQEGVDAAVLEKEGMVIEQIVDGSIFCVCRSDKFIDAILKTKEMGIDNLLVESSGLANPFGMHEVTGMLEKLSPDTFHYSGSICVVDAKHFRKLSDMVPVLMEQVQGADLLLINKTDLSTPEEVKKVEKGIFELNNEVPIIKTSFSRIPDDAQIQGLSWHRGTMKGLLVKQTPGIDKFVLKFDPVPVDQLVIWLKEWADQVYRVKGFCSENNRQFYVQAVHDDVRVSEIDHKQAGNFLIALGPADREIREMVQSSWSEHFQTELTLA
jgi:G3E family GTPase